MNLRQELLQTCREYVKNRINLIDNAIGDLEESLTLETKCSMGDKYETSRAMLHLEFEKFSAQREEFQKMANVLERIRSLRGTQKAALGSIVRTTSGNFFVAIPAGRIVIGHEEFMAIGPGAPIFQAMKGKEAGEVASFRDKTMRLISVE